MENVIEAYEKLKILTSDIEENTNEQLRQYNEQLAVPPNSLKLHSPSQHEKSLKKQTSATSSSTSILSQKNGPTISQGPQSITSPSSNNVVGIVTPTIPEVDHDSENDAEEEDTNSMFIQDQFHIRNHGLFTDSTATSKELVDLLSSLSNEEIQPILDEIITTSTVLDQQKQESQYEENYDLFLSLIQKMKQSSELRVQHLSQSLQQLLARQKEILDITVEKYRQEFGFYRMKNRQIELLNQIQKYSFKLSEIKYELSLKQDEFNISAEDLRSRYEQELETMIRNLIETIEDQKGEINELTSKNQSIQQDIQRICNDLSLLLHELDREEKAKAYQAVYGANKKYIDNRPLPAPLPTITPEKIEEAFSKVNTFDQNSINSSSTKASAASSSTSKGGNAKGKSNRKQKTNKILNNLNKVNEINRSTDATVENAVVTISSVDSGDKGGESAAIIEEEYDPQHIFQVYPFLDTNEITENMVIESLKITDSLLLEVDGKRKELQQQEEKIAQEKLKLQALLKSEENKSLERLKLMVTNLEEKIEADGQRVELLQTLVKNLKSESTTGEHQRKHKSISHSPHFKTTSQATKDDTEKKSVSSHVERAVSSGSGTGRNTVTFANSTVTSDQTLPEVKNKETAPPSSYDNLSEVEVNVLKYQELFDKCHNILQIEQEKILSREKTPKPPGSTSASSLRARPISSSVSNVKPFSAERKDATVSEKESQAREDLTAKQFIDEQLNTSNKKYEKRNIKRIVTPQQVSKIHKIMEMFDYFSNLTELSEVDKVNNTLIPYSNIPLGSKPSSDSGSFQKRGGSALSKNKSRDSLASPLKSQKSAAMNGLSPGKSRPSSQLSFLFSNVEAGESSLTGMETLNSTLNSREASSQGRRAAITASSRRSINSRSRSPGSIVGSEELEGWNGPGIRITAMTAGTSRGGGDDGVGRKDKEKASRGLQGYQLMLEMKEKENQEFFSQNYGYKIALEQISTIYNILLKWNHPAPDQQTASNIVNNSVILQADREENELLTIEVLKSQIESLLSKSKTLYKQNTYYNSIIKDLSKELIQDIKKNNSYQQELIQEISNLKWNQNTLPGKYQIEIDLIKERLVELKRECKVWEGKVAKRRVTNIRLSHLLSENSKNVRKALPLKSSFKMIQAMIQENPPSSNNSNDVTANNSLVADGSHPPVLYSSSLTHGPQPFPSIPMPVHLHSSFSYNHKPSSTNTQASDLGIDVAPSPVQPRQPTTPKQASNENSNLESLKTSTTTSRPPTTPKLKTSKNSSARLSPRK